jgi:uncharacterized phage-associated protein
MAVRFDFDNDKAVGVICLIASAGLPGLTKGKICKLIFLADRLHLVRYGRPITGDDLYAMAHGPVPSKTLNLLGALEAGSDDPEVSRLAGFVALDRRFQYPHFQAIRQAELDSLSSSDLKVLEEVIREHGQKTFRELRALTHEFDAYKKAWEARIENRGLMRFEDLFEDEDPDAIEGAREEMLENASLREALCG